MGDFNVSVGVNAERPGVCGKYGLETMNDGLNGVSIMDCNM